MSGERDARAYHNVCHASYIIISNFLITVVRDILLAFL